MDKTNLVGPVRVYYRALIAGTREVWCESRDPVEVAQSGKIRDHGKTVQLVFEKLEVYEVASGWGKWDGTKP
jgi:hypothetical protein